MGNRLLPTADGCCPTLDRSDDPPHDESAEQDMLEVPAMPAPRGSFEIMSHFTWEMVDSTLYTSEGFFCY